MVSDQKIVKETINRWENQTELGGRVTLTFAIM